MRVTVCLYDETHHRAAAVPESLGDLGETGVGVLQHYRCRHGAANFLYGCEITGTRAAPGVVRGGICLSRPLLPIIWTSRRERFNIVGKDRIKSGPVITIRRSSDSDGAFQAAQISALGLASAKFDDNHAAREGEHPIFELD